MTHLLSMILLVGILSIDPPPQPPQPPHIQSIDLLQQQPKFCTMLQAPNRLLCNVIYLAYIFGFTDHGGPVLGPPTSDAILTHVEGADTHTQCLLCNVEVTFPITYEQCQDPSRISMYYDDGFLSGDLSKSLVSWEFDRRGELVVDIRWTIKDLSSWSNPHNYTADVQCGR